MGESRPGTSASYVFCPLLGRSSPRAAQAYELLVASGGRWTSIYSTAGNNLQATRYVGPAVSGSALKIRMTTVGGSQQPLRCILAGRAFSY